MIKNIIKSLVGQASTIIDDVVTTDEERLKLKMSLRKLYKTTRRKCLLLRFKTEVVLEQCLWTIALYKRYWLSSLLVPYFFLSYTMFKFFVLNTLELSDYEIGFVSSVFGAMSSKVNTIIDFFFGGSSKSKSK